MYDLAYFDVITLATELDMFWTLMLEMMMNPDFDMEGYHNVQAPTLYGDLLNVFFFPIMIPIRLLFGVYIRGFRALFFVPRLIFFTATFFITWPISVTRIAWAVIKYIVWEITKEKIRCKLNKAIGFDLFTV